MLANEVGLSTKVVSERHYYASQTKKSAGEVVKILKKKHCNISAKDLVNCFTKLNGREPEWHHSGFYKGKHGSTMGRTFFFSDEQISEIEEKFVEYKMLNNKIKIEHQQKIETKTKGFYYTWDYDYSGRYGKKRNHKVLNVYEGNELNKPKKFVELSDQEFEIAKQKIGEKYYGWDEPQINEFQI
jgi:hypothetical protein